MKFPCPIGNHKHELNTCATFFSMSPAERWNKWIKTSYVISVCILRMYVLPGDAVVEALFLKP